VVFAKGGQFSQSKNTRLDAIMQNHVEVILMIYNRIDHSISDLSISSEQIRAFYGSLHSDEIQRTFKTPRLRRSFFF
jgi:hypothetical protein